MQILIDLPIKQMASVLLGGKTDGSYRHFN